MHGLPLYLMVLAAASAYASPASPSSDRMPMFNSTLQVAFAEDNSRGLFQDGVTLLRGANGNNDTSSQVPQGLLLQFNQSTGMAANGSSSVVPFFALVSCDQSESLVGATLNSTLSTEGNSTTGANSTMTTNSTSVDVFSLAATLNAVAVILYSELEQTCTLNTSYFADSTNVSVPIYALSSQQASRLLLQQFNENIEPDHRIFNVTLLSEALANLTSIVAGAGSNSTDGNILSALPANTGFLLSQIVPTATDDAAPIVATIGPAASSSAARSTNASPSEMGSSSGTSAPSPSTSTPVSGATRPSELAFAQTALWAFFVTCGMAILL